MYKILVCILIFVSSSFAYTEEQIAKSLKQGALKHDLDSKILYTIAKIESGFNPYIIAFTAKSRSFYFGEKVNVNVGKYKKKYLISIKSRDRNELARIARELIEKGYKVDIGLMQINSQNFDKDDVFKMFELDENIAKASQILKQCGEKYSNIKNTIQCYNSGFSQGSELPYFNKFKQSFNKDFGGVI